MGREVIYVFWSRGGLDEAIPRRNQALGIIASGLVGQIFFCRYTFGWITLYTHIKKKHAHSGRSIIWERSESGRGRKGKRSLFFFTGSFVLLCSSSGDAQHWESRKRSFGGRGFFPPMVSMQCNVHANDMEYVGLGVYFGSEWHIE